MALFLIQSLALLEGKVQKGVLKFTGNVDDTKNWQFLSKFGYGLGDSEYMIRFRLPESIEGPTPHQAKLALILDEEWLQALDHVGRCNARNTVARRIEEISLEKERGRWSDWKSGMISQSVRPHIWYFVASLCDEDFSNEAFHLEYEVQMAQSDKSEFSVEMKGMMTWNLVVLTCLVTFLVRHCSRCREFASSAGHLHPVIWALSTSILLQFSAQSLHTLHLLKYQSNGTGILFLDWLSEVLFMFSQVVQTTLLIAIAMGYTLLPSRNSCIDVVRAIAGMSFFVHAALVSFGKMQEESASKFHENEGAVGWVLLSVRLMLFGWFAFSIQASQQEGGLRLHAFLQKFRAAGSLYFLAYPILFVVVQIFAEYLRHPIMQIGLISIQSASNVCLAELFLSRGTYFKVSSLSSSLLPGSYGLGGFNKFS